MLRIVLTACAIAFLGGVVTGKSVLAQEWVGKPIQCDSEQSVTKRLKDKGLQILGGLNGFSNSVNYEEPLPVFIFLGVNPDTREWAIVEAEPGADDMCILTYGTGITVDLQTLGKLSGPGS